MTLEEAAERLQKLRDIANDDEAAHSEEDRFWQDVLEAIAFGDSNPHALALIALQTLKIDFSRWCA